MGQMLTAKQLAEVKGCSFQYIQKDKRRKAPGCRNGQQPEP
ncbi:MAG: hypothetical protein ACLSAC_09980 [Enterocloster bolteae]